MQLTNDSSSGNFGLYEDQPEADPIAEGFSPVTLQQQLQQQHKTFLSISFLPSNSQLFSDVFFIEKMSSLLTLLRIAFLSVASARGRSGRLFSLFNTVYFQNSACTGIAGEGGLCLSSWECQEAEGGRPVGNCAAGFGRCCHIRGEYIIIAPNRKSNKPGQQVSTGKSKKPTCPSSPTNLHVSNRTKQ